MRRQISPLWETGQPRGDTHVREPRPHRGPELMLSFLHRVHPSFTRQCTALRRWKDDFVEWTCWNWDPETQAPFFLGAPTAVRKRRRRTGRDKRGQLWGNLDGSLWDCWGEESENWSRLSLLDLQAKLPGKSIIAEMKKDGAFQWKATAQD